MRRCLQLNDQANSLKWRAELDSESKEAKFIYNTTGSLLEKWAVEQFNLGLEHLESHLQKMEQREKASFNPANPHDIG